jgi:putative membrane protein
VFAFLAAFLFAASRLLGWKRTGLFFGVTWITAFVCEHSSTRTGIPFWWYHYNESTVGQELYLSNIPFMDSLSFTFLPFASYTLALLFTLPQRRTAPSGAPRLIPLSFNLTAHTSWATLGLSAVFMAFIDIVIDPVALRGDR